jgi:large conductance mechanosensitive channel
MSGFRNFLMRGDVIVVAIGLAVATAFSTLVIAFTENVINPIVARFQGGSAPGLGVQLGDPGNTATYINFGNVVSAMIYFVVFMAVLYFVIVVPYKHIQARRGLTVFGDPAPTQTCPACKSADLPEDATKCRYCTSDLPVTAG